MDKTLQALLFLNGNPPKKEQLERIFCQNDNKKSWVVCADGAYNYLKNYCKPDLLVGDFDSLDDSGGVFANEIIRLEREKDMTDGHFALLELIRRGFKKINIFGAFGGRPELEFCNYSLLKIAHDGGVDAVLIHEECDVFYTEGEFSKKVCLGAMISLAPFSDLVHIKSCSGLKYPIFDEDFAKTSSKGVSNVAINEEIGFKISEGGALVFVYKESKV